jgi:hypothetical protein
MQIIFRVFDPAIRSQRCLCKHRESVRKESTLSWSIICAKISSLLYNIMAMKTHWLRPWFQSFDGEISNGQYSSIVPRNWIWQWMLGTELITFQNYSHDDRIDTASSAKVVVRMYDPIASADQNIPWVSKFCKRSDQSHAPRNSKYEDQTLS